MSHDPNESDLLIDFDNSVSSRSSALDLKAPSLLPPPNDSAISHPSVIRNEESNNPFDLVINKTLQHVSSANDPFEIMFQRASKASCETKTETKNNVQNTIVSHKNSSINEASINNLAFIKPEDSNNPFDLVISKSLQHASFLNDPFEVMFEKASKASCENKTEDKNDVQHTGVPHRNSSTVNDLNKSKFQRTSSGMELNLLRSKLAALTSKNESHPYLVDEVNDSVVTNIMDITDPTGQATLNLTSASLQMSFIESQLDSANEGNLFCESNSKISLLPDTNELNKEGLSSGKDSSSDSSLQQSKVVNSQSVEEIKAMIAKRVNICIQNALEDSKHAINIPHRRAFSSSSINLVLPKNSSFTNDYCDAPPLKPDVKDLKTDLERIKSSWKNCSFHQSALNSTLPNNNSESTTGAKALSTKKELFSTAPLARSANSLDVHEAPSSQELKIADSEVKENYDPLYLTPAEMDDMHIDALFLSGYLHMLADNSSEEDLLNSTPPWEKCDIVLPEHGSDEDLHALTTSWQKLNTANSFDGARKSATSSFIGESPVKEQPKFQSCPTTPILCSSSNTKADSASGTSSELVTAATSFSDEKKQHLTLRTRLSLILNKNALPSKPELPATPPLPVKVVAEEGKTEIKLRPKRKQAVEKKGPLKAVVPLDNMTRPTSAPKKSAVKAQPSSQRQPLLSSAPLQGKRSPSYSSRASSDPPGSTPSAAGESKKAKMSTSPSLGFQGAENRKYTSPKGGAASLTPTTQLQIQHSGTLSEDKRISPASSTANRNVGTWQKLKTNVSATLKSVSKSSASTDCQTKSSSSLPQADTSSNVITSTPVKNPQIPKFQSSPIYHTDSKEKEAGFKSSQLNTDGISAIKSKLTASNVNSKKKLTHTRSRSLGNVQNRTEKMSPASSENKQSSMTSGAKASKVAANILKPLAMLKPTNKPTNRKSWSEKPKEDDNTKTTSRIIAKMRRSAGASLEKENMKPS